MCSESFDEYTDRVTRVYRLISDDILSEIFRVFPHDKEEEIIYPFKIVKKRRIAVRYDSSSLDKPIVYMFDREYQEALVLKFLTKKKKKFVDVLYLSNQSKYIAYPDALFKRIIDGHKYFVYASIRKSFDLDLNSETIFSLANNDYIDNVISKVPAMNLLEFLKTWNNICFTQLNEQYAVDGYKYIKDNNLPMSGRRLLFFDADTFVNCRKASWVNWYLQQTILGVAKAIRFIHSRNCVLMDLNSENILSDIDKTGKVNVKLMNLERCVHVDTKVQSLTFIPPEICAVIPDEAINAYNNSIQTKKDYLRLKASVQFVNASKAMDVWLFGILIVRLFCSQSLVDGYTRLMACTRDPGLMYRKMELEYNEIDFSKVHPFLSGVVDLIMKTQDPDPSKRIGMEDIIKHPFMTCRSYNPGNTTPSDFESFINEYNVLKFIGYGNRNSSIHKDRRYVDFKIIKRKRLDEENDDIYQKRKKRKLLDSVNSATGKATNSEQFNNVMEGLNFELEESKDSLGFDDYQQLDLDDKSDLEMFNSESQPPKEVRDILLNLDDTIPEINRANDIDFGVDVEFDNIDSNYKNLESIITFHPLNL